MRQHMAARYRTASRNNSRICLIHFGERGTVQHAGGDPAEVIVRRLVPALAALRAGSAVNPCHGCECTIGRNSHVGERRVVQLSEGTERHRSDLFLYGCERFQEFSSQAQHLKHTMLSARMGTSRVESVADPYLLVRQPVRERLQRPLRDVMLGHLVLDAVDHGARGKSNFLVVVDQEARDPDTCACVKRGERNH